MLAGPNRSSTYSDIVMIEWPHDEGSVVVADNERAAAKDLAFMLIQKYFEGRPAPTITLMDAKDATDHHERRRRGPPATSREAVLQRMRDAYDYVARRDPKHEPMKYEVAKVAGYTAGSLYRLRRQHNIGWPP